MSGTIRTARTTGLIITTGLMTIGRIRIKRRCRFSLALDLGQRGNALRRESLRQQHDGLRAGFAVLRDFQIFR